LKGFPSSPGEDSLSATPSVIERPVSPGLTAPAAATEDHGLRPTGIVALLRRQPRGVLTAVGLLLAAALAVLDLATPPNLSFLIFYIAPVLFLVWFVGRRAALLATALAAAVWTYEDVLSAGGQSSPALAIWSVATRFGFFVLFVEIVGRLKTALERSHRAEQREMEREVEIAQAVQLRLFPQTAPSAPGLDCHGVCRPVRGVAGDYYDFLPLGPGKLGVAVGDVAGKGISAALLMASLQASLRSYLSVSRDGMADVTREMNRQLFALTEPTRFATLFWGISDEKARTFRYVNAGHDPPFLLRRAFGTGSAAPAEVQRLTAGGLPLGAFAGSEYREASIALEAGDLIAIYTDGITEATNPAEEEFGVARLQELLRTNAHRPAADLCRRVLETVDGFRAGSPQHDDMTLLIVRVPAVERAGGNTGLHD
jgi:serine phosphatase RsbU (regulator of sigma subunit)